MNYCIKCENVCKDYLQGSVVVHALSNVSFSVEQGEFLSICGPSGSGKSTLLNVIGGLDTVSSGTILLGDLEMTSLTRSKLADIRLFKIGFVFQAYNLIPVLSAAENVEFVMQLQGVPVAERREKVYKILNAVGLEGLENRRPGELSGGQQQRVAVARAIVSSPEIVLADEPTANLDSRTAQSLLELMLQLNQELNISFIFSTHDELVMKCARRIIKLVDGSIASDERYERCGK